MVSQLDNSTIRSRSDSFLVIEPSKYAYRGLAAHSRPLKERLLAENSPKQFVKGVMDEWRAFKKGLKWMGSEVHLAKPLGGKSCPDCMFAQDLALRLRGTEGEIFVSPRKMGAVERQKESARLRKLFGSEIRIVTIPGRIDFGDVIAVETGGAKLLLVGVRNNVAYSTSIGSPQKLRTTKKAIDALEKIATEAGYEVVQIEHSALHLTTAMTMAGQVKAGDPIVFLHNRFLKDASLTRTHIARALGLKVTDIKLISTELRSGTIEEKAKATWSSSCVGHNGKVLIQEGTEIAVTLIGLGFKVLEIPFDFIRSIDGGMTCLVLELIGLKPARKNWKKKKKKKKK